MYEQRCWSSNRAFPPNRCAVRAGRSSKWLLPFDQGGAIGQLPRRTLLAMLKKRTPNPKMKAPMMKRSRAERRSQGRMDCGDPAGRFFLRVGLGRKSLALITRRTRWYRFSSRRHYSTRRLQKGALSQTHSPRNPTIKVLDPAVGSGHFLVEACRFFGQSLYESCRLSTSGRLKQNDSQTQRLGKVTARRPPCPSARVSATNHCLT